MDIKEIRTKLKKIKIKTKNTKGNGEELSSLRAERLRLETELITLKQAALAAEAKVAKIRLRKAHDHFKFLLGGLVIRDNPGIIEGFPRREELEKMTYKAILPAPSEAVETPYDPEKWETIEIDGEEFCRLRRG